jgi:hypothetical protein
MKAGDYLNRLRARDQRRGTTLWVVFHPESYLPAFTADPFTVICELVLARKRTTPDAPINVAFYSIAFPANCPDNLLVAILTLPRDCFLSREDIHAAGIGDAALFSVLRHPHGVRFGRMVRSRA